MLPRPSRKRSRTILERPFIEICEHDLEEPGVAARTVITIGLRDWTMIAARADDGRFILVHQHRHGIDAVSLELPGGIVDAGEEPDAAARRELREETGYEARSVISLGWVHPNPALQGNRAFFFYTDDAVKVGEPEAHDDERTLVELVDADQLEAAIGSGRMTHALAVVCASRALVLSRGLGAG